MKDVKSRLVNAIAAEMGYVKTRFDCIVHVNKCEEIKRATSGISLVKSSFWNVTSVINARLLYAKYTDGRRYSIVVCVVRLTPYANLLPYISLSQGNCVLSYGRTAMLKTICIKKHKNKIEIILKTNFSFSPLADLLSLFCLQSPPLS